MFSKAESGLRLLLGHWLMVHHLLIDWFLPPPYLRRQASIFGFQREFRLLASKEGTEIPKD